MGGGGVVMGIGGVVHALVPSPFSFPVLGRERILKSCLKITENSQVL